MTQLPEDLRKKKFLVVDDYEVIRLMVAEHLKQLGVEHIAFASSGNKALDYIKKEQNTPNAVEVLMTDLLMEDGSGLDLVKGVRAIPSLKSLPILMITSKAEVALVIECVKAGVNNYIVKPWELEDLAKKIIESCEKIRK